MESQSQHQDYEWQEANREKARNQRAASVGSEGDKNPKNEGGRCRQPNKPTPFSIERFDELVLSCSQIVVNDSQSRQVIVFLVYRSRSVSLGRLKVKEGQGCASSRPQSLARPARREARRRDRARHGPSSRP
jgi:hypothetical protein